MMGVLVTPYSLEFFSNFVKQKLIHLYARNNSKTSRLAGLYKFLNETDLHASPEYN